MPAGVFRAMWDALEAKRPFAGFVRNRAADGSPYEVLATVTPLPAGGYLSVRTRPMTEAAETAFGLYTEVREQEREAEESGQTRREVAQRTAAALSEALGVESYERFQWGLLPAELAAREAAGATLPDAPVVDAADAADGTAATAEAAVAEMITALRRAHDLLGDWTHGQEETGALAEDLGGLTARVSEAAGAGERVRAAAEELDLTGPQRTLLLAPLQIWANMHGIVSGYLGGALRAHRAGGPLLARGAVLAGAGAPADCGGGQFRRRAGRRGLPGVPHGAVHRAEGGHRLPRRAGHPRGAPGHPPELQGRFGRPHHGAGAGRDRRLA